MTLTYLLPSSPRVLCGDRFSILDRDDELQVPFWDLFTSLLESAFSTKSITNPSSLIDLLETLAVSLRGKSGTDYGFLRNFLTRNADQDFYETTLPAIFRLALKLPDLFPEHQVTILSRESPLLTFSREQIACIVVHQFLCTLLAPAWQDGFQDFDLWYDTEQPHASAVEAYLSALFTYFNRIASDVSTSPVAFSKEEWCIRYELCHADTVRKDHSSKLSTFSVLTLAEASTAPLLLGLPNGASVISANKFIGFGRSGTQEETHVGASPECCPAVLFIPPLQDDQVLVVQGVEAMIGITGYGRDARCEEILCDGSLDREQFQLRWSKRTMLFMDALELDLADRSLGEPVDLQPGNVARELQKASTAFLATGQTFKVIVTGFWGCKTFGGNPAIKAAIQWCAASRAGSPMTFVCSGSAQASFAVELRDFVKAVQDMGYSREFLERTLLDVKPEDVHGANLFEEMLRRMSCSHSNIKM